MIQKTISFHYGFLEFKCLLFTLLTKTRSKSVLIALSDFLSERLKTPQAGLVPVKALSDVMAGKMQARRVQSP